MQCSLNFSNEDRTGLFQFLKKFPQKEVKSNFEDMRCEIGNSTVTLYKSGKLLIQGSDCEKVKGKVLKGIPSNYELVLGIDETGRGESFGPFVIAGVLANPNKMRELRDSKKIKKIGEKRKLVEENALGIIALVVSSSELFELHKEGVSLNDIEVAAINKWHGILEKSGREAKTVVDGKALKGSKPGISFLVKGDDINPVVGAASVIAKSVRDESHDKAERKEWGSCGKRRNKK